MDARIDARIDAAQLLSLMSGSKHSNMGGSLMVVFLSRTSSNVYVIIYFIFSFSRDIRSLTGKYPFPIPTQNVY
jgi:hypothetical protein